MKRKKGIQRLSIFVAILTLAALSCQGVAGFNPFATETPTPTNTFTPTPTFTVTPSPTPTRTPTSTPAPTGVQVEEQADGTSLFIDYDNKYQLVLPEEWVVIPFNQSDLSAAIDELAKDSPELVESAEAFRGLDPDVVRAVALNKDPKFFVNGAATNLNITAIENEMLSAMPLSFITGALEESFEQNGAKVLTQGVNIMDNPHGVEIEYMDIEQSIAGSQVLQRLIVFQSNDKLIMITITTLKQIGSAAFSSSEPIAGSIELLK